MGLLTPTFLDLTHLPEVGGCAEPFGTPAPGRPYFLHGQSTGLRSTEGGLWGTPQCGGHFLGL